MISAYVKIPLQALILMVGVLVFVFYLFNQPPMLFNPVFKAKVAASARAAEYAELDADFTEAFNVRRQAAIALAEAEREGHGPRVDEASRVFVASEARVKDTRTKAASLVKDVTGDPKYNDVNYVFPTFVTTKLPVGLVGLIIAAIFAAAMSASAGEMNALATATVIDVYRRHIKKAAPDAHYLLVSKLATGFWGLVACTVAIYAASLGSLIEVVNRFGSFFYGSLLGVFILAIGIKRATSRGAFWGLLSGMAAVAAVANFTTIAFLWHNVVGAVVVVVVGMMLSLTEPRPVRHS
jgi:Na+(H+)/acetate symporter ActP